MFLRPVLEKFLGALLKASLRMGFAALAAAVVVDAAATFTRTVPADRSTGVNLFCAPHGQTKTSATVMGGKLRIQGVHLQQQPRGMIA